ncbi:MAG: YgiT-type zinc finger protein [Dehalococcoidia bacterium]|nr:YgiT-type zinc finger protein [Dehalococcoidia bacterium]
MNSCEDSETMVDERVAYTIEVDGRIVIIENVPARVCRETGERYFSPDTVEHLQSLIWRDREPDRVVEVPVFDFA